MWHRMRASIQKPEAGRTQARSVMTSAHSTHHKQQPGPLKHPPEQSVPSLRRPEVDRHIPATTCILPGQRTAGNDQPRYATKYSPRFEDRACRKTLGRIDDTDQAQLETRMQVPQRRLDNRRSQGQSSPLEDAPNVLVMLVAILEKGSPAAHRLAEVVLLQLPPS